ncbi:hypothetical protein ABW19_dt0205468 [Dactylella cylindrospora]|nr:hypothetical protein ABW19_dt0205468 [Dactylella cylindrospora]
MATDEESDQLIYDLAGNCERLFEELLLLLPQTGKNEHRVVLEHQQRFERWAGYLGVFAAPQASLDNRLKSAPGIRDQVVQLLEILERNIRHGLNFEATRTQSGESAQENQPILTALRAALAGIQGALDRLHRLGIAIRKASTSDLTSRVQVFTRKNDDDRANFERIALLIVKGLYPNIEGSLANQLAKSISFRRQRLLYQKQHQLKLKARRRPRQRSEQTVGLALPDGILQAEQKPAQIHNERQTRETSSRTRSAAVIDDALTVTHPSIIGTELFRLNIMEFKKPAASNPSTVISIDNKNPYPLPPKVKHGEKHAQCGWCFKELEVPDDETQWKSKWR